MWFICLFSVFAAIVLGIYRSLWSQHTPEGAGRKDNGIYFRRMRNDQQGVHNSLIKKVIVLAYVLSCCNEELITGTRIPFSGQMKACFSLNNKMNDKGSVTLLISYYVFINKTNNRKNIVFRWFLLPINWTTAQEYSHEWDRIEFVWEHVAKCVSMFLLAILLMEKYKIFGSRRGAVFLLSV